MTLCYKDPGVHGFCVAIEGGSWLVQECEVFVLDTYVYTYIYTRFFLKKKPRIYVCMYYIRKKKCVH